MGAQLVPSGHRGPGPGPSQLEADPGWQEVEGVPSMDPCSWLLVPWEESSRDVASGPYSVDKVPISVA